MPQASGAGGGAGAKYAYLDHDTVWLSQEPPVQNQWYTVFIDFDVRLLGCFVEQENSEMSNEDIEVRWTCDGNVYQNSVNADYGHEYEFYRNKWASSNGTEGLGHIDGIDPEFTTRDKRAQSFEVQVRLTSAGGTNQKLRCWCVYETLEVT
jgi:hypothetical protein